MKCHDYVIIIGYVSETLLEPTVSNENEGFKCICKETIEFLSNIVFLLRNRFLLRNKIDVFYRNRGHIILPLRSAFK